MKSKAFTVNYRQVYHLHFAYPCRSSHPHLAHQESTTIPMALSTSGRHSCMYVIIVVHQTQWYPNNVTAPDLYLIQPPPGALHKPISPQKIVFAGDSAGGGLCITALTVLRDMGQPLPAGAALISPWVDLTHSFPSVMENTETVCY